MNVILTNQRSFLLLLACLLLSIHVFGQDNMPRFEQYHVKTIYNGKSVAPIIDKNSRMFLTRVKYAAKQKRNFAGEYVLAQFGCGAECRGTFIVSQKRDECTGFLFLSVAGIANAK